MPDLLSWLALSPNFDLLVFTAALFVGVKQCPGKEGELVCGMHPLMPLHPQEIRKAYPPTGARYDAGRTGRL